MTAVWPDMRGCGGACPREMSPLPLSQPGTKHAQGQQAGVTQQRAPRGILQVLQVPRDHTRAARKGHRRTEQSRVEH